MKIYMEGERERVVEEERDSETEIERMKERERERRTGIARRGERETRDGRKGRKRYTCQGGTLI